MNLDRLLQRFLQYVTCSSESGDEKDFCLMIEDELTSFGMQVERQEIGELIGSTGWNIRGVLQGECPPLLLCAHLDTASPGKNISPTVYDRNVYSNGETILGADNKAAIAAIMETLQTLTLELKGVDQDAGNSYKLWFENEYHVLWKNGSPWITSPDIVQCVDSKTANPLTNTVIKVGDEVSIVGMPAREQYNSGKPFSVMNPRYYNFDFDHVPIEKVLKD